MAQWTTTHDNHLCITTLYCDGQKVADVCDENLTQEHFRHIKQTYGMLKGQRDLAFTPQQHLAASQLGGIIAGQMQKQNELPAYLRDMASHDAARGGASAADFLRQYAKTTFNTNYAVVRDPTGRIWPKDAVVADTSGTCDICDEPVSKIHSFKVLGKDPYLKVCTTCQKHLCATPTEVTTKRSRSLEKLREVKLYQISYVVGILILLYFFMS